MNESWNVPFNVTHDLNRWREDSKEPKERKMPEIIQVTFYAMTAAYVEKLGVLPRIVANVIERALEDLKWYSFEVWLTIHRKELLVTSQRELSTELWPRGVFLEARLHARNAPSTYYKMVVVEIAHSGAKGVGHDLGVVPYYPHSAVGLKLRLCPTASSPKWGYRHWGQPWHRTILTLAPSGAKGVEDGRGRRPVVLSPQWGWRCWGRSWGHALLSLAPSGAGNVRDSHGAAACYP
ncbi:hypothetical protein Cgig2_006741 [Carnegiea gigantea]|uniref:Uncharacterized protein n=1 Tax=Carnegiea gigantea TaxID=171969 RepID=A0A9Q1GWZ7_9CARY|nr:hypothetical protein Cgig2_006741 [Carnegiea gigantea]